MRDAITGDSLFNANKMIRQLDSRVVIMFESDADLTIVDGHEEAANVRLTPGNGKEACLEAARLHREAGDSWAVAFVDKDLDNLERLEQVNVYSTDHYDLDAEIFFKCPSQVYRVIRTHCGLPEPLAVEKMTNEIIETTWTIGVIRFVSIDRHLGAALSHFPMHELFKPKHGASFLERALAIVSGRSGLSEEGITELSKESARVVNEIGRQVELCNGHDLMAAMAAVISRNSTLNLRSREFAAGFRAAVDCACLKQLTVHLKLSAWANSLGHPDLWTCAA